MKQVTLTKLIKVPEVGDIVIIKCRPYKANGPQWNKIVTRTTTITGIQVDDIYGCSYSTNLVDKYGRTITGYVSNLSYNEEKRQWRDKTSDSPFSPETVNISNSSLIAQLLVYKKQTKEVKIGDKLWLAQIDKEIEIKEKAQAGKGYLELEEDCPIVKFKNIKTVKKYSDDKTYFNAVCISDLIYNEATKRFEYYKDCR